MHTAKPQTTIRFIVMFIRKKFCVETIVRKDEHLKKLLNPKF